MRKVGIDKSGQWVGEAFGILRAHPAPFLLMGLIYTLISQLPYLGVLITLLLGPALIGGMLHAANLASANQAPRVGQMFHAFTDADRIGSYMALCLPYIGLSLIMIILLIPAYPAVIGALRGQTTGMTSPEADIRHMLEALRPLITSHIGAVFVWLLAYVVLAFIASMLTLLAPARIMFAREGAFTAMRNSFIACRTNFGAYFLLVVLLFSISLGVLILASVLAAFMPRPLASILAMTPFNVLVALVVFAMHRGIFGNAAGGANPAPEPAATPGTHTFEA